MDYVKGSQEIRIKFECIALDELKRVVRLRIDIDTDNFKSSPTVANASATRAAKQIKKSRFSLQGFQIAYA